MGDYTLADLFTSPAMREILKAEMERSAERMRRWREMFPDNVARVERQERGEFTAEEVECARRDLARNEYPPTAFGCYLRERDEAAVASLANDGESP